MLRYDVNETRTQLSGKAILISSPETGSERITKKPNAWFWKVLFKSKPLYGQTLMASLIINIFAIAVPLFTMNVYDRVVPHQSFDTLWVLVCGIALVFLIDTLLKKCTILFHRYRE